jgi:hypothetical protein
MPICTVGLPNSINEAMRHEEAAPRQLDPHAVKRPEARDCATTTSGIAVAKSQDFDGGANHTSLSLRGAKRRSNPALSSLLSELLRGACHRAPTRWLAMT